MPISSANDMVLVVLVMKMLIVIVRCGDDDYHDDHDYDQGEDNDYAEDYDQNDDDSGARRRQSLSKSRRNWLSISRR